MSVFISVRNWRKFQHYDPALRVPPWIKNNTELMSDDQYLELTEHRALLVHRLWLEYASSRCRLRLDVSSRRHRPGFDTASLGRRLSMRVTTSDIEALVHAGFIEIVASAELAEGYQPASASRAREEGEEEEEKDINQVPLEASYPANGTTAGTDDDIDWPTLLDPHAELERARQHERKGT